MTSRSAERFGITDRGVIAPGRAADIVVFDPDRIADSPPEDSGPARRPKGIQQVLVNGTPVVEEGIYVGGAPAGRVLRL
jgi:N-acyl-D-amino-acid deacylase